MKKPKTGNPAPDFSGTDQNGKTIRLKDYRGGRLVLYFYPKDNTPGCTSEACNLRDNYEDLLNRGFRIIRVSPDSTTSHQKFSTKHSLPFPLISDTDKSIMKAYGAWGEKSMYGKKYMGVLRKTFIFSEDGIIENINIFDKVNTRDHTRQILETLEK